MSWSKVVVTPPKSILSLSRQDYRVHHIGTSKMTPNTPCITTLNQIFPAKYISRSTLPPQAANSILDLPEIWQVAQNPRFLLNRPETLWWRWHRRFLSCDGFSAPCLTPRQSWRRSNLCVTKVIHANGMSDVVVWWAWHDQCGGHDIGYVMGMTWVVWWAWHRLCGAHYLGHVMPTSTNPVSIQKPQIKFKIRFYLQTNVVLKRDR